MPPSAVSGRSGIIAVACPGGGGTGPPTSNTRGRQTTTYNREHNTASDKMGGVIDFNS